MRAVRALIAWGTYPVGIGAAVAGTAWGIAASEPGRGQETLAVAASLCGLSAALLLLQPLAPRVPAWQPGARDVLLDATHGLLSTIGGATLARLVFFGGIAWLSARAAASGWGVWPDAWPLWAQVPLAVLVSDFVVYWLHRASHRSALLWRLHELHHTSERLYALSSGRTHPMYVALSTAVTTAPLLALGADPPVLALLSAVTGANGIVQHSNLDLRCAPWAWVLATADAHRWHHAVDPGHQASNYGNTLSVWDRLFGTWDVPPGVPNAVGVDVATPRGVLGQLVRPFLPHRAPAEAS